MTGAEQWRPVVGFEGAYEVSDRGRVRSLDREWMQLSSGGNPYLHRKAGRVLRPGPQISGHLTVALGRGNSRTVHSLVAEAFIGPRLDGTEVRHLNGVETDNRADNLVYGTRGENTQDKKWHGKPRKLTVEQVRQIKTGMPSTHSGREQMAAQHGVHVSTVYAIKNGVFHKDIAA